MPYPDPGPPADAYPTSQQLRDDRIGRRAARLGAALGRVDAALDELAFRAGGLATDAEGASDDDLEYAERVADTLEVALAKLRIGQPPAASDTARRGGWA